MKKTFYFMLCAVLGIGLITFASCRKEINVESSNGTPEETTFSSLDPSKKNLRRTILGEKRRNPYTVENMNKAYTKLYGKDGNLKATHRYVKFNPTTPEDIKKIEKSGINVYDYPLDYEVIEMGDYYRRENAPENEQYSYYAALGLDKEIPDVPNEPLADLYLLNTDEPLVREAISLVGYNPDTEGYIIFEDNPGGGGGGNGGGDLPSAAGPLVQSADCSCRNGSNQRNPSGCIKVEDTNMSTAGNCDTYKALRRVKVILKDTWFTEDEIWTDDKGCFSKRNRKYYGRCWMWVKFTNDRGHIRSARSGISAVWDWLFTVKDYVGMKWGPTFNNINVCYDFSSDAGSTAHYFWSAATVNNALHEYYDFASQQSLGTPPANLDIYAGRNNSHGYAMMADKLTDKGFLLNNLFLGGAINIGAVSSTPWLAPFYPLAVALTPLTGAIVEFFPDVYVGVEPRNSDKIKEVAYHEFGHAAHYENLSWNFRNHYWIPNIGRIVRNGGYGDKADNNSGKCAVIEAWGYHIGQTISNRAYGTLSSGFCGQSHGTDCLTSFFSNSTNGSSYIQGLEAFDPNLPNDPFNWIPKGVLHDLHDANNETSIPVIDNCSGFNHKDFFNALNDDVNTVEKFRDRILQNTGNRQQIQVNQLFQQYGY
jgi:hypothetical protein